MDSKDQKILKILSENSRMSIRKIARKIEMKPSSVFNRMKKLEKNVIKRYTIDVDLKRLGFGVLAYVFVSYSSTHRGQERLAKDLSKYPQVLESSIITGDWDILLKVAEKNVDTLGEFITNTVRKMPGVARTMTIVVLKDIKRVLSPI